MNFEKKIKLLKDMKNKLDNPKFVYLQNLDNLSLFEEYVKKIEEYFTYIDEYFNIVDSIPIAKSSYETDIRDDKNHDERGIRGFIRRREPIPYLEFFNKNKEVIRFRTKALVKYEEVLAIREELQKTHRQGFKIREKLEKKYTQGYSLMESINFEILIEMENLITASIILLDKGDPNNDKAYIKQLETYIKEFETYKKQLYQEQGRFKLPDTIMATPVAQEAAYYNPSLNLSGNQRRDLSPTKQQASRIGGIVPAVMRPRLKARATNQEVKQLLSPVDVYRPSALNLLPIVPSHIRSTTAPPVSPLVPARPPVARPPVAARPLVPARPPVARPPVARPPVADSQSTVRTPRPRQAAARRNDALAYGVRQQHNNKSPSSKNHSFKSKSPPTVEKPVFEIVKTEDGIPRKVYLIDAKDDGLCFINAIFDYLLYSDKLSIMYERLLAIEKLILKNYGANIDILRIKKFALSRLGVREGTYDLLEKQLIPIIQINEIYHGNKNEKGQLIRLTGIQIESDNPKYEDYTQLYYTDTAKKVEHLGHPKIEPDTYKTRRINFAISMKYVLALYILSYGKNKFTDIITDAIKNTLFAEIEDPDNSTDPYRNEWNAKLLKYYKDTFKNEYDEIYRISDEAVATPTDIAEFVYQYVFEYMSDDNKFYANQTLIIMFGKILFKKLSYKDGTLIPRFWLEIEKAINEPLRRAAAGRVPKEGEYLELRENAKFTRVLSKYRFRTREEADAEGITSTKYIHIENSHDNYISLLCDENRTHYLAFLLEEELKYQLVDKPKRGGKPKRPKTATKRPKTAPKPKRPKTAR
jgi:hypothetical protein